MQADEVSFSCAMAALTIFRYLTDHAEVLHVSVASRMARHHDFVGMLVEVMEQAPWTRTERFVIPSTESAEGGGAKKKAKKKIRTKYSRFQNNAWSEIEQGDRTLCQAEAQVWLALHALILADPNSAMKYEFDDHKKETVQRLKKHMHEVLVDQLPPLSEMRRCLEELTLMETPPASSSPFVIEQVSEMRTEIEKCCDAQGGFKKIAEKQLRSHFSMSAEDRRADVMRMAALYEGLNLEELSAGSKGEVSDAELLERHGALELGRMYLGGRKPGEEGEGPSIAPPPPQFPGPLFACAGCSR